MTDMRERKERKRDGKKDNWHWRVKEMKDKLMADKNEREMVVDDREGYKGLERKGRENVTGG